MRLINWDDQDIGDDEIYAALESLKKGVGAKGDNLILLEEELKHLKTFLLY